VLTEASAMPSHSITEWIRVWAHEMPAFERDGWRFSHALVGGPSEQLYGPDYRDCRMVRRMDAHD